MSTPDSGGAAASSPYRPYHLIRTPNAHSDVVSCVKFSNDGQLLASASLDEIVILWSATTLAPHRYPQWVTPKASLTWLGPPTPTTFAPPPMTAPSASGTSGLTLTAFGCYAATSSSSSAFGS
ncbi:COMPASS-like H3K4 histone methylase component WDR5B [Canna indica]|uniref:COMPASS-like H3K4 histone methylase component WDR5B n=1 Tax=Canna indica TaxID=4628 RepID=A0AAQ3KFU8_9LILI|nr:COMPASS-like H3K4 histone methylase component WDR5B [Canna indica]